MKRARPSFQQCKTQNLFITRSKSLAKPCRARGKGQQKEINGDSQEKSKKERKKEGA